MESARFKELLTKAMKYCAYQERCQKELRNKLYQWEAHTEEVDQVIARCIEEGFINEERFARAYAGGKFRTKSWGKEKIIRELQIRDISDYCIRKALEEIEDDAYALSLKSVLTKKMSILRGTKLFQAKRKAADHAIRKGYEPAMVWELLNEMYQI
jgi:regulatory protein